MSSSSERELEEQLLDAGNRLVEPPSSDDELLQLLDQVENFLLRVDQSPTKSMQTALSPALRALVAEKLVHHPNADVKVAVASCISEITRITAPDAPYDDDQMKEVFQLIVSSFENLSDNSSRSYAKRTSILETVSKVRSCVVMLDLECDALIVEMFEHFLGAIRDYHPDNVFSSMETIMTLVLEESEDISKELLSPILASVKKKNEEVLPIARKLGERVLESCASKVKPYLIQAVKSLGFSVDDYSLVVASLCEQEASSVVEQNDGHATPERMGEENRLERTSSEDAAQADKKIATGETSSEHAEPAIEKSPKSTGSNDITQTGEVSFLDSNSKKQEDAHHVDQSQSTNSISNTELDNMETEKADSKVDQTTETGERKPSSSKSGPSDGSRTEGEKEAKEPLDDHKSSSKDDASSPCKEPSIEADVSSDHEKGTKALESESGNVASPSPSDSLPEEGRTQKVGRPKKKETSTKDTMPSADVVSKQASEATSESKHLESESGNVASPSPSGGLPEEGHTRKPGRPKKKETSTKDTKPSADAISKQVSVATSDPKVKPTKRSGKKPSFGVSNEHTNATKTSVASKNDSGAASDSEVKASKESAKKVETSGDVEDGSLKRSEDKKKQGRVKSVIEKDATKSSAKDDREETVSSPKLNIKSTKDEKQLEKTPQTNSKRKRTPDVDKQSVVEYDENLVGAKIKVWWPKDRAYYEGVVDYYDSAKKKHKILYIDGDEEILNLKRQKWQLVARGSESDEGEEAEESSLDVSPDVPQKKKAKAKANSDLSTKQGKLNASSKKGGGASSSKAKSSATKSGRKSSDAGGADSKTKSEPSKRSEDDSSSKAKVHTPTGGSKSATFSKAADKTKVDDTGATKSSSKSKDVENTPKTDPKTKQHTPKTTGKAKQDILRAVSKPKGRTPKGGGKSSANGNSKVKSGSSKVKEESEDAEASSDSAGALESVIGKSSESSKVQQASEAKTGKKRRRGARN